MRKDLNAYYRALGLTPGAGAAQIRRAYRQLVRQWHPDLFKPGSPMQTTAEDITKDINEAYDQLFRKGLHGKFRPAAGPDEGFENGAGNPRDGGNGERRSGTAAEPGSSGKKRRSGPKTDAPPPKRRARSRPPRTPWRGWKFLGAHWGKASIAALLLAAAVPPYLKMREHLPVHQALASRRPRPLAVDAAPTQPAVRPRGHASAVSAAKEIPALSPREVAPFAETRTLPVRARLDFDQVALGAAEFSGPVDMATRFDRAESLLDVFEIGDTRARVIAIQGPPDGAGDSVLRYGSSLVYFENGRVKNWSDGLPRLRVRAWPAIGILSLDTFFLGSTREDVVRAQGEPAGFTPLGYTYGTSTVYFEDDRVAGWSQGDVSLKAFVMPSLPFIDLGLPALR